MRVGNSVVGVLEFVPETDEETQALRIVEEALQERARAYWGDVYVDGREQFGFKINLLGDFAAWRAAGDLTQ